MKSKSLYQRMINDVSNDPAMCSRLKFCQSTPRHHDDIAHQDDRPKPCSEMEYKPHAEICQKIPSKNMLSQICLYLLSQKLGYFDRFGFTKVVLTALWIIFNLFVDKARPSSQHQSCFLDLAVWYYLWIGRQQSYLSLCGDQPSDVC